MWGSMSDKIPLRCSTLERVLVAAVGVVFGLMDNIRVLGTDLLESHLLDDGRLESTVALNHRCYREFVSGFHGATPVGRLL